MTTHQPALTLPDDGIIDLIAVEIAARGTRPVALTRAEGRLAAAAILARGGTPNLISKRLHVSGTTALTLAARCRQAKAVASWLQLIRRYKREGGPRGDRPTGHCWFSHGDVGCQTRHAADDEQRPRQDAATTARPRVRQQRR